MIFASADAWKVGRVGRTVGFAALLAVPLLLQAQPTISGYVRNAQTGYGLSGMDLDVFDAQGHAVTTPGDRTGAGGAYTLTLPGAGSYFIRADPDLYDLFADQYYSNAFLRADATLITVGPSDAISGVNFDLQVGFVLQGFVRAQGVGLADIDLDLYAANGEFLSGYPGRTAVDGRFVLGVLPPGTYCLRAQPDIFAGQFFVPAYFDGSLNLAEATPIVITNADVNGVVVNLFPGGAISGHVADAVTGAPLAGFDLDIYDTNHVSQPFNAVTDTNGDYVFGPLPPGSYQVRVDPSIRQGYARTYYTNSFLYSKAQPVVVEAGKITSSVNFSLVAAGWIEGSVSNAFGVALSGIPLDAYEAPSGSWVMAGAATGSNGFYQLGPLPPGNYSLRCSPSIAQGYSMEYFNGKLTKALADPVTVVASKGTSNVNFVLDPAGSLSGRLLAADTGKPMGAGVTVDVLQVGTLLRFDQSTDTTADGRFAIEALPLGTYLLRAEPLTNSGYFRTYYGDTPYSSDARPIVLNTAGAVNNLDIQLIVKPSAPSLKLLISLIPPSRFRISIEAAPGPVYQLETRENLTQGAWAEIGAAATNVTGTVEWEFPIDSPTRFYRARIR